jgi:hypothetical protein
MISFTDGSLRRAVFGFVAGTFPSDTILVSVTRSRLLALIVIGILLEPFHKGSGLENQRRGQRDTIRSEHNVFVISLGDLRGLLFKNEFRMH